MLLNFSCKGQNSSTPIPKESDKSPGIQYDNQLKRFGVIGENLQITVPFDYNEIHPPVSEFMIAKKAEKYGVINSKNKVIHKFIYSHIFYNPPYMIGSITKDNNTYCCLIDTSKGVLIPIEKGYNSISLKTKYKENNYYFVAKNFKQNFTDFYNENGILDKHFPFSSVEEWGEYLIVESNGNKGISSWDGKILLNPEYKHIDWIDDNIACAYYDLNKPIAFVIDLSTKKILSNTYNTIRKREENGCMIVSKLINSKKLYGIISSEFKEILPLCDCLIEYIPKHKHFEITNNLNKEIIKIAAIDLLKK